MIGVYCFSGSGHSRAAADFFAGKLGTDVQCIGADAVPRQARCRTAVVVFPVYCQNIPAPVKRFLKDMDAEYAVLIATYGRISYGNVLYEAKALVSAAVIAGAYVPTGHTFLRGDSAFDSEALLPILERIGHPKPVCIPRLSKDWFADLLPAWRSRVGVKLIRTEDCTSCNVCGKSCPMGAIRRGRTNARCIRCLHCVFVCPRKALSFETRAVLRKYLMKHYKDEGKVYL